MKKIAVYYCKPGENDNYTFWGREYAEILTESVARNLGLLYERRNEPILAKFRKPYGLQYWPMFEEDEEADIHFVQAYAHLDWRPKGMVVVAIGDYRFYKSKVHGWIEELRPDLVLCTDEIHKELKSLCKRIGARIEWMPFFVTEQPGFNFDRDITAFISGCIGQRIYHFRSEAYQYLKNMSISRDDVLVSCSEELGKYPCTKDAYFKILERTKYYITGGVFDEIVPPKVFEAAAAGCCVICNAMPMLEEWGFVDGETCIVIDDVNEIGDIINGDSHKRIGPNANLLVSSRHTVDRRAEEVAGLIKEII